MQGIASQATSKGLLPRAPIFLAGVQQLLAGQDMEQAAATNDNLAPLLRYLSNRLNCFCERNSEVTAREYGSLQPLHFRWSPSWLHCCVRKSPVRLDCAKGHPESGAISEGGDALIASCGKRGLDNPCRRVWTMDVGRSATPVSSLIVRRLLAQVTGGTAD